VFWIIEVKEKPDIFDAIGEGIKKDILDLGIKKVSQVRFSQIYIIEGNLLEEEVKKICTELLTDNITQEYSINDFSGQKARSSGEFVVEIAYNHGVMDPVEESTLKGIRDLKIQRVHSVKTAKKFLIKGDLNDSQLKLICEKLLYNRLIQHVVVGAALHRGDYIGKPEIGYKFQLSTIDLLKALDKKLQQISSKGQLFLSLKEMQEIRKYFRKLKRNPTDCELETIAQTWSEHCCHKTFRGKIAYSEEFESGGRRVKRKKTINNLLKSTIMKVTKELNKSWCVSVFKDNSGIIKFDDQHNVCFKVETHNHPSALEPFGGANTGMGGVIRDCLGTGLGAKPILNTDVFCFAHPDYPFNKLPAGTLHPKRIMKGVVSGVRDYGNKMGIPTVNGAVLFNNQFVGNPLVYCGTAGILPKDKTFKQAFRGDLIVVVGGRTGRDGIHGATFSSGELTQESEKVSSGAVQIGNPIQEKKMSDVILKARDLGLYSSITDCGAGGLSSAVGEMGKDLGVKVELEKVPLKYKGLSYAEIWISESQERMVLAVPKEKLMPLLDLFGSENVECAVIGEFSDTKRLQLYYKGNLVCNLQMQFLHDGFPQVAKKAVFTQPNFKESKFDCPKDLGSSLLKLLSHHNICSKEWVIRQYDHEVGGGSVSKPLVGIVNDGPSDAAVVKPVLGSSKGIAISCGINFNYGLIDPYWMAASCIDEALRQIIAVGGSLKTVAILDNFCWGNPDKPDRLGGLVRASLGCYDVARGFGVPFISGKDSLNNEYAVNNKSLPIPGTLLISAMAVLDDVSGVISMYAKKAQDLIYVVGLTEAELGGSCYYDILEHKSKNVPKVYPKRARKIFEALSKASARRLIKAMHDCSEGGLGVALAEMAFAGGLGMDISLKSLAYKEIPNLRNDFLLFSESNSRFVVEVEKKDQKDFQRLMKDLPFGLIGSVAEHKELRVRGIDGSFCINLNLGTLKEAWQKPLRW
jgi:phosphoribosylformylglycinamidine synthase II